MESGALECLLSFLRQVSVLCCHSTVSGKKLFSTTLNIFLKDSQLLRQETTLTITAIVKACGTKLGEVPLETVLKEVTSNFSEERVSKNSAIECRIYCAGLCAYK